jgi:hypothetical protein
VSLITLLLPCLTGKEKHEKRVGSIEIFQNGDERKIDFTKTF